MSIYEQELEKANEVRDLLLPELEKRILGKILPGWQCNCGAIKHGESSAVAVVPGGKRFPYQVTMWYSWTVNMRHTAEDNNTDKSSTDGHYSNGLDRFYDADEIKEIFEKAFDDVDQKILEDGWFGR